MRAGFTRSDLRGARLWWVVSVQVGRTYRWAESPLSVASDAGNLQIMGGLGGGQVDQLAPWMGRQPEVRRASADLIGLNVAPLLALRLQLDSAPAEVALLRDGDVWEDRLVLLSGYVVNYDWGGDSEPLHLELEQSAQQDRGLIPDTRAVVSSTTWPYAASGANGLYYPTVLGQPGQGGISAVPALMVESVAQGGAHDYLLIAGHPVSAASVTVFDGSTSEVLPVVAGLDGEGRAVALVDLSTAASVAADPAADYTAAWTEGAGYPTARSQVGAGSLLELVLGWSTLPVDFGFVASARDMLDRYTIGAFCQDPISPMDWVTQALLPLLPVAVLVGPSGWRVVPVPVAPTTADCSWTIEAGDGYPGAVRLGPVRRVGRDDVANDLALRYALDTASNASAATARLSGAGYDGTSHTDLSSQLSQQVYGRRVWSEDTVAVYDSSTAYAVLRWRAIAYAFSRNEADYSLSQEWAALTPGSMVRLLDHRLGVDVPCWVSRVALQVDGRVEATLIWGEVPRG